MNNLRPLSIGEVLDVAFKLYFKHWARFAAMVAVIVVPVQVVNALIRLSTIDGIRDGQVLYADKNAYDGGTITIALLEALLTLLVTAVAFRAVSQAYMGGQPSIGGSLRFALARTHSLLWVYLLVGLGTVLGFIALIIPGIYLWAAWAVAVPVLLVEGTKGSKALGRSRALVRGRWWQVFAVLLVAAMVIRFTSTLVLGIIGGVVLVSSDSLAVYTLVNGLINGLVELLVLPVAAAVTTVLYYDLRVRKEAFDLSLMIDALELPGAGDAYPPVTVGGLPSAPAPGARPAAPTQWEPPRAAPTGVLPAGWAPPVAPDAAPEPPAPEPPASPQPPPDPMPDPFNAG